MWSEAYGLHRVIGEEGALPQRAQRLDPSLPLRKSELLIEVESLNIDAASFEQIRSQARGDTREIAAIIRGIVRERGKMHNPATGSGGMLMGKVRQIGAEHPGAAELRIGDRVASLVSLTLTPLAIDEIGQIHLGAGRVEARGHAILFATGIFAKIPDDLPDALSLAALDVCGAPALAARYIRPGMKVAVLGAGKSGALCLAQARRSGAGPLIALDISDRALSELRELGLCDATLKVDATRPVEVMREISRATGGSLCEVVINCASVSNTEMATLLTLRSGGVAIFFSMATSFTAAALGAEGVGKDATMIIGNGYVPGHAELTLALLRSDPKLRSLFERRYL
jgi:L-erythro-3,5-diaminohexanoate dehydrogenase